jgi:hypothetical protein
MKHALLFSSIVYGGGKRRGDGMKADDTIPVSDSTKE